MNKNLRTYLRDLEEIAPGELKREKDAPITPDDVPVYLYRMEKAGKFEAVMFDKVVDSGGRAYEFPLISNLFADRHRLAIAMGTDVDSMAELLTSCTRPIPPVNVEKESAPVKEVILKDDDADVGLLPAVKHHEGDAGPYITAASVWCQDMDTGSYNCAMLRLWAKSPRVLGIHLNPHGHSYFLSRRWAERKKPMPVVICIGHHPAFYLGTQAKGNGREVDDIGTFLGEPLAVTASETWGDEFFVPAEAEIVLEGVIPPGVLEPEGPFGDFSGYMDPCKPHHIVELKAMTYRRDAIYLDIFSGHRDHFLIDAPMFEHLLLMQLRQIVPGVKKVHLPCSGACRFHAYIQLEKTNDGQPHTLIHKALSSDFRLKHVVVVDPDIDIENEEAVLWAVATRSQWERDLVVLPRVCGTLMDPSGENGISSKGGIDATVPLNKSFPLKSVVQMG